MILRTSILLTALALPFATYGQDLTPAALTPKTVHIRKISASIQVDGKLDEAVWSQLEPIAGFTQTEPDLGAPVSEKTEAFIFYDEDNIYFGFKCYDREPAKIIHRLGAHDGRTYSDSVDIFIDTFHDRRTGYYFSINSRGIQFDAISNEGNIGNRNGDAFSRLHDGTWDGIWYSAASLESWGWSAEVAIPFKSIRLPRASTQSWGLNLNRTIVRKNESASWQAVTRFDQFMRPSKAGTLNGLENIHVGRNLELIPFVSTSFRRAPWQSQFEGARGNGGLDLRYGLTQNLTANLALNPDFADTESDEFTSQISRFEIFFPEKRKFFTEGANYFTTPMDLFFSRRIGARLPDGEPQRILEGGKITGKSGPWTLGALQAVTQRTEFTDPETGERGLAPAAFFGVLRLQRNLFQKSALGFLSVNRLQHPGARVDSSGNLLSASESVQALDLNILKGANISWASQIMVNANTLYPGLNAQHLGWQSRFTYDSEKFRYSTGGKFLGREVDLSQIGFEPETGRWSGHMTAEYKPFINRWGIRQIFAELNYDESNGTRGELEDAGADFWLRVQFKNFWNVEVNHSFDRVRFNDFVPCDSLPTCTGRGDGRLGTTRVYQSPKYRFHITTNENRVLAFGARYLTGKLVQFNEHFYGLQKQFALSVNARLGDHSRLELSGVQVRESLSNHVHFQNRNFLVSRWLYQFTPKLRTRVLAQYEDDHNGSHLNVNSLLAYDFTARSAVFLGYNHQRHNPLDPADLGHAVFLKFSYLFGF